MNTLSLVTGGAGFIGSNLVDYLLEQGHSVICVDNESANNEKFYWNDKSWNVNADVTDYNAMKKDKWEYYTGKAPAEVYAEKPFDLKILRTDIDKYLESDTELQRSKQKFDYLESTVDFLDRTIRLIANRGFTIKNAIDWRKFTSGAI